MSIRSTDDDSSSSAPSSSSSSNESSDFMVSSDTMSLSNTSDTSDSSLGSGVSSDDGRSNSSDGASDAPRDGGAHTGALLRFSAGQAAPDRIPDNLAPARLDKDGMVANEGVQLEVIGDVEPPRAEAADSGTEHLDQLVIPIHTNRMIPMLPQYALVTKYSWPHPVVRTDAEMDAAWDALNGLVQRRGALMMFRNTRKGCQVVPAVHALALLVSAVLVSLSYHGTVMENEAVWRLSTITVNIFLSVPLALVVLTFICFIFPDITRTRKRRAQTICFFVIPYVVTYIVCAFIRPCFPVPHPFFFSLVVTAGACGCHCQHKTRFNGDALNARWTGGKITLGRCRLWWRSSHRSGWSTSTWA